MNKIGRNAPCHCGSNKKYKKCCLRKDEELLRAELEEQQYERDVQSGRIDAFASDDDWEESEDEWLDEGDEWLDEEELEDEDDFDSESDILHAPAAESRTPPEIEEQDLSEEDDARISGWWSACEKISDPDALRKHIEDFMDSHPGLVVELGLEEDVVFELEQMYVRQNRHEQYIEFLSRLRSEFSDTYFELFAYYDEIMISWLVMTDQKEKIADHLLDFRRYPAIEPDNLFNTIHFLMSWNCQDILADFIPDICHEVCTSPEIIGGGEILNPRISIIMAPYLDMGPGVCDPEQLAKEIESIGDAVNPEWSKPEFIQNRLSFILGSHEKWDLDGCRNRSQAMQRYDEMTCNFMGWLNANKKLDWCAAEIHSRFVMDYLAEAMPERKKPRDPFPFEKNNMMRLVARLSRGLLSLDPVRLFGTLNGLYWFMEFLEDTGSLAPEQAELNRQSCLQLFEEAYPAQRVQDFKALAWEKFPRHS